MLCYAGRRKVLHQRAVAEPGAGRVSGPGLAYSRG